MMWLEAIPTLIMSVGINVSTTKHMIQQFVKKLLNNMENQPTQLDKAVKISIIAGALIVALSFAYYLVIFLPKKEATRIEEKHRAETTKLREDCLAGAERDYLDYTKRKDAIEASISKSGLVPLMGKSYDKNGAREECYVKYPQ